MGAPGDGREHAAGIGAIGRLLEELAGITVAAGHSGAPTPVKTRLRADGHPVARFDEGCQVRPAPGVTPGMLEAVEGAGALIVADYGRGLTSHPALRAMIARLARSIPVIWDPHPAGAEPVAGITVVTPNLSEARAAAAAVPAGSPGTPHGVPDIAGTLLRRWQSSAVLVTQGGHGATLVRASSPAPVHIPAPHTAVTDACGAGDRLAGSLAAHLMAGGDVEESCHRAVREAAAFLAAGGVAALPSGPPTLPFPGKGADALAVVRRVRAAGGTVVATGGCFDLLHAGHARTLAAARRLGDCLIVCLNSDASVRRIKGASRPIIGQQDRTELLQSLECVDAVLVFEEDTPERALDLLRPDLWVKGGDYDITQLPETALMESWGGRCLVVPHHPARSTTRLAAALARVG
ncbi:PfkB family carbohydrate kinase [uncultured Arthrobacter sp.]|uniref:PfkB family carbohydrate kinase n=1 Tax=uncultured Arthrobacter sp. TaxID=114050 RepID=UPI0032169ABB